MADHHQAAQFHAGTLTDGWHWLGAHPAERRNKRGWIFRVWAPHAQNVSVVGDFNSWDETANRLARRGEIWEGFIPGLRQYDIYKYAVTGEDGETRYKADPMASTWRPVLLPPASCMISGDSVGRTPPSRPASAKSTIPL